MDKPVEHQSLALPFFALAMLLALATGWACYEELVRRRPWKALQETFRDTVLIPKLERERDLARAALDGGRGDLSMAVEAAERKLEQARALEPEIEQYWVPDLAAASPPGVDRCGSCHSAIDRCGFTDPREVVEERRAFAASSGDPDPDQVAANDALLAQRYCVDAEQVRLWAAELDRDGSRTTFTGYAVPVVFRTHPHREELLGENHPPERFGCTICHGGEGPQTKGTGWGPFRHGGDDPTWSAPLLDEEEIDGHPLASRGFVQSSCAQCHPRDTGLRWASTLGSGRQLVEDLGCSGCHSSLDEANQRRPGPPLTAVRSKVTLGWLQRWIGNPRALRPHTRMPNFWPEATDPQTGKDRPGSAELRARTDETAAIAAYLWATSAPQPLPPTPRLVEGNAQRGRDLVRTLGCLGCHTVEPGDPRRATSASDSRDVAPDLGEIGSKTTAKWLVAWLKDPRAWWAETRMPNFRLSDAEAADVATYLAGRVATAAPGASEPGAEVVSPERVAAGKALIARYGCFGCHAIAGFEQAPQPGTSLAEFGKKTAEELDFGDAVPDRRQQTWSAWVALKLRRPRAFAHERVALAMPQYDLTDDELEKLMVYLKSQRGPPVVPVQFLAEQGESRAAIIRGEHLLRQLNCRGCHRIDGQGGAILDRYRYAPGQPDDLTMAPPPLKREGAKVQPEWAFEYLKRPSTLRPWLTARMPTFALSDEVASELVHGLAASAGQSWPEVDASSPPLEPGREQAAKRLFQVLQCAQCHLLGPPPPGTDLSTAAPNLYLARRRLRPSWITAWLTQPSSLDHDTKMPSYFTDGQSPVPDAFGGDAHAQIEALGDLLMHLDEALPPAPSKGE